MRQGKTRRIVQSSSEIEVPIMVEAPEPEVTRTKTRVRTLGRYRIGAELATGGMATVYLAVLSGEGSFEKVVALKCIHPHLAKETQFVDMFLDEARIASRVSHHNVVQIFDFGEASGSYFLAMEYLPGLPLGKVFREIKTRSLRGDPVSRAMLLRIVIDIAGGLHAIHELRGASGEPLDVVHRDVSPNNILVTVDGVAKLIDLGIARAADQMHRTATHEIKGSLPYISPEALRGEAIDRRADVWSLGVVLWEACTVERLFLRGSAAETLFAVANDLVRRADAVEPSLPRRIADVAARALERDRDKRYATARDFARELEEAAREQGLAPTSSDLAEWLERLFPQARTELTRVVDETRSAIASVGARQRDKRIRTRLLGVGLVLAVALAVASAVAFIVSTDTLDPVQSSAARVAEPAEGAAPKPTQVRPPETVSAISPAREPEQPAGASEMMERAPGVRRTRPDRRTSMEPEPARVSEPSSQEPGRITIVTPDGWADVYSGGRRLGPTPLAASLPAGAHTLVLRPFGRGPSRRIRVEIEPGQSVRRSVRLN